MEGPPDLHPLRLTRGPPRWARPLSLLALATALPACQAESQQPLEGEVTQVGADAVTLDATRLSLPPVLAGQLHTGDRIRAELGPDGQITRVQFLSHAPVAPSSEPGLPLGATLEARSVPGLEGTFSLGAGQGVPTVLGFLYTTCGVATACPLLSEKLRSLQTQIAGAGRVVTLTLDPEFDTMSVLKAYGQRQGARSDTWLIGRLELDALQPLLDELGVVRAAQGGAILHSQTLYLLDADGRLSWQSEGNTWEVADLAARVRALGGAEQGR